MKLNIKFAKKRKRQCAKNIFNMCHLTVMLKLSLLLRQPDFSHGSHYTTNQLELTTVRFPSAVIELNNPLGTLVRTGMGHQMKCSPTYRRFGRHPRKIRQSAKPYVLSDLSFSVFSSQVEVRGSVAHIHPLEHLENNVCVTHENRHPPTPHRKCSPLERDRDRKRKRQKKC